MIPDFTLQIFTFKTRSLLDANIYSVQKSTHAFFNCPKDLNTTIIYARRYSYKSVASRTSDLW